MHLTGEQQTSYRVLTILFVAAQAKFFVDGRWPSGFETWYACRRAGTFFVPKNCRRYVLGLYNKQHERQRLRNSFLIKRINKEGCDFEDELVKQDLTTMNLKVSRMVTNPFPTHFVEIQYH